MMPQFANYSGFIGGGTGGGGSVNSVTASSPLASSGGANPNISLTGVVAINHGGTGQTTAPNAINALLPTQTGHSGEFLTTNGTVASWGAGASGITQLTGDVTAGPGSGSQVATLATVNGNVGTFGSSTAIPNFTVNAKGLITAAGTNVVIAPAGTLTGTTLAANIVSSSLTSVGTITTGVWNGTTIAIANGGTGQTSASAAFGALSPLTTKGDILGYSTLNARIPVGTNGQVLTADSGQALGVVWSTPVDTGITQLTGDATAGPGSGSQTLTFATVNGNVGTFGSSTAIPTFTVNAKGLLTAASTNAVVAPAGTLTGTTLAANVVSSSLTSVGTITTGVWNGTTIDIAHGGTNSSTALNNNRIMQSSGGAIVEAAAITAARALKSDANGIPIASTATAASLDALSGTNTGDVTLAAVGASPNANAASLSGQVLNLQPFDSTHPGVVTASGGGTTNFLRADGTWATPSGGGGGGAADIVYFKQSQSSGINAGGLNGGGWNTRILNTYENTQTWASLTSNQFTLDDGTYEVIWSAPAVNVTNHQTRIFDITNSVTIAPGSSEYADNTSGLDQSTSKGEFLFTATGGPTTYELQHYATNTHATNGAGNSVGAGENEIYGQVKVTKLS